MNPLEKKLDKKIEWAIKKFDEKDKLMEKTKTRFKIDSFTMKVKLFPFGEFNVNFVRR